MKKIYKIVAMMLAVILLIGNDSLIAYATELEESADLEVVLETIDEEAVEEKFVEEETVEEDINDTELQSEDSIDEEASDKEIVDGEVTESQDISENTENEPDVENSTGYVAPPNYRVPGTVERDDDSDSLLSSLESKYINPLVENGTMQLRDQNPFGSCWAFSSIGMAEYSLASQNIKSGADLSELHLAYFTYNSVEDPFGGTKGDQSVSASTSGILNWGGNYEFAGNTLTSWIGAASESTAPYSSKGASVNKGSALNSSIAYSDEAHLENIYRVNLETNPEDVKKFIKEYGGAGISFYAADGYSAQTSGDLYNEKTNSYYCPFEGIGANHAVMIVGWDDNYDAGNFAIRPEANGAWLVRNSWTTGKYADKKGYSGYFWMSYCDKGLDRDATVFVFGDSDNYDNNYQYDGGAADSCVYSKKVANVFTAQADSDAGEELEAVSFAIATVNTDYSVSVYKNLTDLSNPESGTLVATKSGQTIYEGTYTVELDDSVHLDSGDIFSVVVEAKDASPYYSDYICEMSYNMGDYMLNASAEHGQSFYKSGANWDDFGAEKNANIRIKAFTKNSTGDVKEPEELILDGNICEYGITINKEDTYKVSYSILPENATNKKVNWSTSDDGVATVDDKGTVTGVGVGTAVITASTKLGAITKTFEVTVTRQLSGIRIVKPKTDGYSSGESYTFSVKAVPEGCVVPDDISWASSDGSVVTIESSSGVATFNRAGNAQITVTAGDGMYKDSVGVSCSLPAPNVTAKKTTGISISWNEISGADCYEIRRELAVYDEYFGGYYYIYDPDNPYNSSPEAGILEGNYTGTTYTDNYDYSKITGAAYVVYYVSPIWKVEGVPYNGDAGTSTVIIDSKIKSYKITYDPGIGRNDPRNTTTYTDGEVVPLYDPIAPEGYDAIGWYEGTYMKGCVDALPLMRNDGYVLYTNYTLTAKYNPHSYTIKYYANGGTGSMADSSAQYGKNIVLRNNAFTKKGYTFDGWNTETDGAGVKYSNKASVKNLTTTHKGVIRLYAQWAGAKFNITLNANGGKIVSGTKKSDTQTMQVATEGKYQNLPEPERYGYDFIGWYTDKDAGDKVEAGDTVLTEALNLYAHYTPIESKVSFDGNGQVINLPPITVSYGTKYGQNTALPKPVGGTGYEFTGWYREKDCITAVTDETTVSDITDHTLYAGWFRREKADEPQIMLSDDGFVYMTCSTPGAVIRYNVTTDNAEPADPAETSAKYTGPVSVYVDGKSSQYTYRIKAQAVKDGYEAGAVVSKDFPITPENQDTTAGLTVNGIDANGYDYTGAAIKPEVKVCWNGRELQLKKDYTVTYKNNTNAYVYSSEETGFVSKNAPTVIIKFTGNYNGTHNEYFKINPINLLTNSNITIPDITLPYNNRLQKGTTKITYNSPSGKVITLRAGSDFTYSYPKTDSKAEDYDAKAFTEPNEAGYDVTVTGKGNYTGTTEFKEIITNKTLISKVTFSSIPNYSYTGSARKPEVTLIDKKYTLEEGTDYTVNYSNNKDVGVATVTVTGTGSSYTGTATKTFKITGTAMSKVTIPADMGGAANTAYGTYYNAKSKKFALVYDGTPVTIAGPKDNNDNYGVVLQYKENKNADPVILAKGIDYTVSYLNNDKAGTATVIFTGMGGYTGTVKKTFAIAPYQYVNDGQSKLSVGDIGAVTYVKGGVTPTPVVKFNGTTLENGKDYTVRYSNNSAANDGSNTKKLPTVTVTLKGNYKGTMVKNFTISPKDISKTVLTANDVLYANKKSNSTTKFVITDSNGKSLAAGTDYDKNVTMTYAADTKLANGSLRKKDGPVYKDDIVPVGTVLKITANGKNNYEGTVSGLYTVYGADISKATVTINKFDYSGSAICPGIDDIDVVLTVNKQKVQLGAGDYYIASYTNNTNKGTAKITLKGTGAYGGTKTVTFTINQRKL